MLYATRVDYRYNYVTYTATYVQLQWKYIGIILYRRQKRVYKYNARLPYTFIIIIYREIIRAIKI